MFRTSEKQPINTSIVIELSCDEIVHFARIVRRLLHYGFLKVVVVYVYNTRPVDLLEVLIIHMRANMGYQWSLWWPEYLAENS